jgi:hypothetical protein
MSAVSHGRPPEAQLPWRSGLQDLRSRQISVETATTSICEITPPRRPRLKPLRSTVDVPEAPEAASSRSVSSFHRVRQSRVSNLQPGTLRLLREFR